MRRRNAVMAFISILLLIAQLAALTFALLSGYDLVGPILFGSFSAIVLVGLLAISVPINAFVIITIILLVIEASRATRVKGRHWYSRSSKETVVEQPLEPQ